VHGGWELSTVGTSLDNWSESVTEEISNDFFVILDISFCFVCFGGSLQFMRTPFNQNYQIWRGSAYKRGLVLWRGSLPYPNEAGSQRSSIWGFLLICSPLS